MDLSNGHTGVLCSSKSDAARPHERSDNDWTLQTSNDYQAQQLADAETNTKTVDDQADKASNLCGNKESN